MNRTVEVIYCRSITLANGESPLMLRLTKDGKRKYISLHLSVNPIYWGFIKNKPKRNCPDKDHKDFNSKIYPTSKIFSEFRLYKAIRLSSPIQGSSLY